MTEQQIIETLATQVMGWKRYEETNFWYGDNGNLFDSSLWNPLKNIADAWMIVEKIKANDEQKQRFNTWLMLETGSDSIFGVTPKAISLAAYKSVA